MKKILERYGKFYVYILRCHDGTYYTGYTRDIENRIKEHHTSRGAKYIRGKKPVVLAWKREYKYMCHAMRVEYRIKQLTRRKKELLVGGIRLDKVLGERAET